MGALVVYESHWGNTAAVAKAIAEGDIRMTLSDLDKLIRLEAFLSDEPESRHELVLSDLKGKSDEELQELVRQEMNALQLVVVTSDSDIDLASP